MKKRKTKKEREKERILSELYNSQIIQTKVKGFCYRYHVNQNTLIHEDAIQETFYHLSRKEPEYIIRNYDKNGETVEDKCWNLIAICVRIIQWKSFSQDKVRNNPKHSLSQQILFASNFRHHIQVNHSETSDKPENSNPGGITQIILNNTDEPTPEQQMWEDIRDELTKEEENDLDYFLDYQRTRGAMRKDLLTRYENIKNRIKDIIIRKGYKI